MQPLLDSTLADALVDGCDCCQIKYDGSHATLASAHGSATISTRWNDADVTLKVAPSVTCTLIGSFRPSRLFFYVTDCWCVEEPEGNVVDLRKEPYRARYVAAKIQMKLLQPAGPTIIILVPSLPIAHAHALWRSLPDTPNAKGLVFRRSMDPAEVQVRVARWYPEKPGELV